MNATPLPTQEEFIPKISAIENRVFAAHDKRLSESDLSPDQAQVLGALTLRAQQLGNGEITTLGGYAGSGKSTLIPFLAQNLGALHRTAFCCYTGKAANVLRQKLEAAGIHEQDIAHVGTIHSLIYSPVVDAYGRIIKWARKDKLLNRDDVIIDRIIVDEASMVNTYLIEDLQSYGVPIILVGDHGQLPPVEGQNLIMQPEFRLEKIHRQVSDNPIIQLSQTIRTKGAIPRDLKESDNIRFITNKDIGKIASEEFDALGLDMGILVRSNAKRNGFNKTAVKGNVPRVGDILICLKNAPPIYNGMRGFLTEIEAVHEHWYRATVSFPDDGVVLTSLINKHQFNYPKTLGSLYDLYDEEFKYPRAVSHTGMLFDFGMTLTVHKAQGSSFKSVILCPEFWPKLDSEGDGYKRWLYTGVTRAASTLYILRN